MKSLVLGTANFGSKYGFVQSSEVETKEINKILDWAEGKISEIDTSFDYPGSHKALSNKPKPFQISTKINLIEYLNEDELLTAIIEIKNIFQVNSLYQIFIRPTNTNNLKVQNLVNTLNNLRKENVVQSIGASIYELRELEELEELGLRIDSLQFPISLANHEFEHLVIERELDPSAFTIYARSIFLQGILLLEATRIPTRLQPVQELLQEIQKEATYLGVKPMDICLAYVKRIPWVSKLVVGVRNLAELQEIYASFNQPIELSERFLSNLPLIPSSVYDPRWW